MKSFTKGFLAGAATITASIAGVCYVINKQVIEPLENEQQRIDENRRKAMRKSRARS